MANKYEIFDLGSEMIMILQCGAIDTGSWISAPLVPVSKVNKAFSAIMPEIVVLGDRYYLDTPNMAAVNARKLKKKVGDFSEYRELVNSAVDLIFTGF